MSFLTVLIAFAFIGLVLFLILTPAQMVFGIKRIIPMGLLGLGALLIFLKQVGVGSLMLFAGISLLRRGRGISSLGPSGPAGPNHSTVRSAALEMELDHETGAMNGLVLAGIYDGQDLDSLVQDELAELRREITDDGESLALLDAYLDRRFPGWREDAEGDTGPGQGGATRSGAMSEQEAYEVLGLSSGATASQIRQAHRRLMKTAHPDSGGSTFLAAKINEAKDVLLGSHS